MNEQEWWAIAGRTSHGEAPPEVRLLGFKLGLCGEMGEVCDVLKKLYLHGHPLESARTKLTLELGDVYWYVTALRAHPKYQVQCMHRAFDLEALCIRALVANKEAADYSEDCAFWRLDEVEMRIRSIAQFFCIEWSDVLQANADKLLRRFPDGKFTTEASIARVDVK